VNVSLIREVESYSRARPPERLVLYVLAAAASGRVAELTREQIEARCQLGRTGVKASLRGLERAGELVRVRDGGGRGRPAAWAIPDLRALYDGEPVESPEAPARPRQRPGQAPLVATVKGASARPLSAGETGRPGAPFSAETGRDDTPLPAPETGRERGHATRAGGSEPFTAERLNGGNTPGPTPSGAGSGTGIRTYRQEAIERVACPVCREPAGSPCRRRNGEPRVGAHDRRHEAAVAAGAPRLDEVAPGIRPRPSKRSGHPEREQRYADAAARNAAQKLRAPNEEALATWSRARRLLERAVGEPAWELWLAEAGLVAVDADGLVIGVRPEAAAWAGERYRQVLDGCARQAGAVGARFVTPLEAAGFGLQAREAV